VAGAGTGVLGMAKPILHVHRSRNILIHVSDRIISSASAFIIVDDVASRGQESRILDAAAVAAPRQQSG
jgi:hypothetical protein